MGLNRARIQLHCKGLVRAPKGTELPIRSVWIIESGATTPRLVTAYPYEPAE
ncbi:MAG: DUF6883 domain-containing protein [Phycisphaerales bacterium]